MFDIKYRYENIEFYDCMLTDKDIAKIADKL